MSVVQPKAWEYLSCYSQQCTGWVGSTSAQGRSFLVTMKLEGEKAPGAAQSHLGAGVQASLVPMFAAGQQGGKARLILALSQLCLFPLSPH